jgi:hypothetical protein
MTPDNTPPRAETTDADLKYTIFYQKRKFIVTIIALAMITSFVFADKMDGAQVVTLMPLVLGLFFGGNLAEHFAKRG